MDKQVDAMKMPQIIKEINRLAKLKKTRALNQAESTYREQLKNAYLQNFRQGLDQQLQNTKIIDQNGNDITPHKLKQVKEVNND